MKILNWALWHAKILRDKIHQQVQDSVNAGAKAIVGGGNTATNGLLLSTNRAGKPCTGHACL